MKPIVTTTWRSLRFSTLAIAVAGLVTTTRASLLVYEPFEYPTGQTLQGQGGGADAIGMIGTWTVNGNGTSPFAGTLGVQVIAAGLSPGPYWKGTCTSVPQKGNYAGSAATPGFFGQNGNNPNNIWASRPLDPNIVTNFTLGATNWMSCVQSQNFNANNNYAGMTFSIGAGVQNGTGGTGDPAAGRGTGVEGGPAIGIGLASSGWGSSSPKYMIAGAWDLNVSSDYFVEENATGNTGIQVETTGQTPPVWICIAKIVWGDTNGNNTTVTMAAFKDGTALSEGLFNTFVSTNLQSVSTYIDPSTFTNISMGGGRWNCDELRIGTTFGDVIGIVPATYGNYWAPGTNGGGSGVWAAGSNFWATVPNLQGTNSQSPTNTLLFAGAGGTLTVNGTISVGAGLQFQVGGYSVVPGGSSPQLKFTGATAAANTVSVGTGTNTLGVLVGGTAGLTKAGLGTLLLTNSANSFSGGTVLQNGVLQFGAPGSLGAGSLTFTGGTLQYPPGTGVTPTDLSARISPVSAGQLAQIDTDGNSVTFATGLSGGGGLTKLGNGDLTLAGANTYSGPTTVSGGTLNLSAASGVITALNVPAGGTVNLGPGTIVSALNLTGGKVNLTGAGVQVGALFVSSGTFTNPVGYSLTVTNTANLLGIALTSSGGGTFTLASADLLHPTPGSPRIIQAAGGVLSVFGAGLDVAIGQGSPLIPASPATATYAAGVWGISNGVATDINNVYGKDNHAFHYIQLPTGDFDIHAHVTGAVNASAGLMARDNLTSDWDAPGHNYIGIWTALNTSIQEGYATIQSSASHATPPWVNAPIYNQGVITPWLEIQRSGNLLSTYSSSDGVNYNLNQQIDYSASPWGPTTYLGLDLIDTGTTGSGATFDTVDFMGAAGVVDFSSSTIALGGGAQLNVGPVVYVAGITTNGTALASGCWAGSAVSGASNIDPVTFTSSGPGVAVVPPPIPFTIIAPDVIITTTDPYNSVNVNYPNLNVFGGTPPYLSTNYFPTTGSAFSLGSTAVTCEVTDSACPFSLTRYAYFHVIILPPAPVMNPAVDPNTGYTISGGMPTFTFATAAGFEYRVVSSSQLGKRLANWQPVVSGLTDPNGWVQASSSYMTLIDPNPVSGQLFYRVEVTAP